MKLEWDEAKRRANLAKHGLDFADAEKVLRGPIHTLEDKRFDYGEERFLTIGVLRGTIVTIVHVERNNTTRIISMRKATRYEQKEFRQIL